MKRILVIMAALSLALLVPLASTTTAASKPAAQDTAEADAYKAWYEAFKAQDLAKELELGKAFVEKYPNSSNVAYVKKDIVRVRGLLFNQAVQAKNTGEIIRIGKDVLAQDPDNLDYLIALSIQIRQNELFATPASFSHAAEARQYTEHAIRLIEAGKAPAGADPQKFNKNVTLAYLHQTLAVIHDHEKNLDKALAEYEKSAQLEPSNAAYFFHCGRIHNDKYAAAAQKYDGAQKKVEAMPETDRNATDPKPEVKAALDEAKTALNEVNNEADAVIKCWARFLGLTADKNTWGETRARILQAFTELYKYRHNGSTEGMEKLIEQNRPGAANSSSATSVATKP